MHDTIGCFLNMDNGTILFSKNGNDLGKAFDIPKQLLEVPIYAACVLKNAEIQMNLGATPFKHPPGQGSNFKALCMAEPSHYVDGQQANTNMKSVSIWYMLISFLSV